MLNQADNTFSMIVAVPMFILWAGLITVSLMLINKKKLSKNASILLALISLIVGGFLLGGIPNAVMPIQQLAAYLNAFGPFNVVLPMVIMLLLLLLVTFLFGRIFCGRACPIGALQELGSKVNFKSNLKDQKRVKYKIDVPQKLATPIRWIFLALVFVLSMIWGIALLQTINPFLGLKVFKVPQLVVILVPIIVLIVVLVLSIFIYRPWCRFLCPFGALASVVGKYSLTKYARTEDCTNCGLCEKICPTGEAYEDSSKGECYYCNRCVEICPSNAIKLTKKEKKR